MQELTAEAAAARQAAATAEAETARIRGKSEDIQRKARSAVFSKQLQSVCGLLNWHARVTLRSNGERMGCALPAPAALHG